MKYFLLLYLFSMLCLSQRTDAQISMNNDSLLKQLQLTTYDTSKVRLYYLLSNSYFNENLNEAEKYRLLGGALSKKINYKEGVFAFYNGYADILSYKGNFDSALAIQLEALSYAKKQNDSTEIGRTMVNAGMGYIQLHYYENAVANIEGGRDILIRAGVHDYEGVIFNSLQFLYSSMHQYRKAVNIGLSSIAILEKSADASNLQMAYNNLGLNYIELHLHDSARFFLRKAAALANNTGESMVQITTNLNFALIALREQQVDSIKFYADKALLLAQKNNANEYKSLAKYGQAYYYLLKKDYANCKTAADSALLLAAQYNLRDVKLKIYPLLSNLNYALENTKLGYYYNEQYELLNDSLINESVTNNTISIEKKYETQRKESQIKLQQAELHKKNMLNYVLAGSALGLLLFIVLGYRNYRNHQKLQQAKIDELETEKQLTATEAVLKGEEQERSRLAKDLHDGLGGMLSGIKHSLSGMKENLVMTPDNAQAFERSIDMLNSSINEMRRVAHNLMPEILVKYGLDTALKEYCNEISRSGVVKINYQSIGMNDMAMEQTASVTIYRIVQELVNNAIKHGAAQNLLVQAHASAEDKSFALTVEDDGKGFDPALLQKVRGMGWSNIQNRVDFLKGKIDINSEKDKGTSVLIEINI